MGAASTRTEREPRERLEARLSREQKALLQRAADLTGRTLTDFVVGSAQAAAEEAIRTHEVITLSVRDSVAFVESLLAPSPPNDALRSAAQRHRQLFSK